MDDPLIGKTFGDYQVLGRIGKGGMGVVYRVQQLSLDRPVALKILPSDKTDPEYVERFLREARAAARLNHPNIIQVYDAGVCEGIFFFAMELVDGMTLAQRVNQGGPLEEREALRILRQAAKGLECAHRMGFVHRDVKPDNILLTREGQAKVADLGLVKWRRDELDATLTTTGVTMGTPYYISPEQIQGEKNVDGRSDMYSLGMTFFYVLTGKPAFADTSAPVVMSRHLTEATPELREICPDLSDATAKLIQHMTAKAPFDRIQTMSGLIRMVDRILNGEDPFVVKTPDHTPWYFQTAVRIISLVVIGLAGFLIFLQLNKPALLTPAEKTTAQVPPQESPVTPGPAVPVPDRPPPPEEAPPTRESPPAAAPATPTVRQELPILGSETIRECLVCSRPDQLVNVLNGPPLANLPPGSRLVVRSTPGLEVRALVGVPLLTKPDLAKLLLRKMRHCTGAELRITPVFVAAENGELEVEVFRLLRPWGSSLFERSSSENAERDTDWKMASYARSLAWEGGGGKAGEDFEASPLTDVNDPQRTRFRVTFREIQKPLRINILPELRELSRQLEETGQWNPHYGWIFKVPRGLGEIRFMSARYNEKQGPQLHLVFEEPPAADSPR